jgi:hypothetical protein
LFVGGLQLELDCSGILSIVDVDGDDCIPDVDVIGGGEVFSVDGVRGSIIATVWGFVIG